MFPKLKNDHENHKKLGNLYTYITRKKSFNLSHRVHFRKLNKNTLTGPANCNNTNRHHAHLSLFAKSRKSSGAKSRKWPKTSISAIFWRLRGQISQNCSFFVKNRFYLNWRSYLVLTSGQNPKDSLEPFLREISKCLILG